MTVIKPSGSGRRKPLRMGQRPQDKRRYAISRGSEPRPVVNGTDWDVSTRSDRPPKKKKGKHPRFRRDVRRTTRLIRENGFPQGVSDKSHPYWDKVTSRAIKKVKRQNRRNHKPGKNLTFQKGYLAPTSYGTTKRRSGLKTQWEWEASIGNRHRRKGRRAGKAGKGAFNAGRQFSPAKTEDSVGYWDAKNRGNKRGRSLVNDSRGKTTYTRPKSNRHGDRPGKNLRYNHSKNASQKRNMRGKRTGKAAWSAGSNFIPRPRNGTDWNVSTASDRPRKSHAKAARKRVAKARMQRRAQATGRRAV